MKSVTTVATANVNGDANAHVNAARFRMGLFNCVAMLRTTMTSRVRLLISLPPVGQAQVSVWLCGNYLTIGNHELLVVAGGYVGTAAGKRREGGEYCAVRTEHETGQSHALARRPSQSDVRMQMPSE